jgi:hypothetical protein
MAMRYPHRADWKLGESDPYSAQAAWVHAVPVGLLGPPPCRHRQPSSGDLQVAQRINVDAANATAT